MADSKHKTGETNMLERSLVITKPIYRYALIAFAAAAVIAVLWTLFGSIPQRIEGLGEINTEQGLFKVTTAYRGQVEKVNTRIYENVHKGQILFVLKQPQLKSQIAVLKTNIKLLQDKDSILELGNNKSITLRSGINQLEAQRLNEQKAATEKTISFLQKKMNQEEQLYKDGLITYSQYFSTLSDLAQAKAQKVALESQLSSVSLSSQEWILGKNMSEKDIKNEIEKLQVQLSNLLYQYKLNTQIVAPTDGIIVDISADYGDMVDPGENLATIEQPDNQGNYVVDLFVPFSSNAEIDSGMVVQLEPFTVNYNLYGWLKGKVIEVNEYVSTTAGLSNRLNNQQLAGLIESKGPVYKVTVKIQTDSSTISGFAWSHKAGPPFKVSVGTLCQGYVRVKDKAPIDYLIPIFKAYFD